MGWGLERCRRQRGVINVVIRVLFNVYVCRCVRCWCGGGEGGGGVGEGVGGGPPWHHVVVNHLVILDSS